MADYVYLDVASVKLKDSSGNYTIPVHGVASQAIADELAQITTLGNTKKAEITTLASSAKTEIETAATNIRNDLVENYPDIASIKQDIADINDDVAGLSIVNHGKNYYDSTMASVGMLANDGAINATNVLYRTSELIKIEKNTDYCVSVWRNDPYNYRFEAKASRIIILLYGDTKTPVTASYINNGTSGNSNVTFNSGNYGFVRISAQLCSSNQNTVDRFLQLESGQSPTTWEGFYSREYSTFYTAPDKMPNTDVLYGKKWVSLGDSFTQYTNKKFTDGRYAKRCMTYPYLISLRTGVEIYEQFYQHGRTMAYPADGAFTNSVTCPTADCYYKKIPEDVDYVTIMLGINDLNHATGSGTTSDGEDATGVITLGTIDDTETSTYFGAYNNVLSWLRENRPYAHVGIIVTNGTEREQWTNAQIALAKKYGYPYLNLNGDDRTPAMIRCYNPSLSSDLKNQIKDKQAVDVSANDTHPNWQTHQIESTLIENFLRSI